MKEIECWGVLYKGDLVKVIPPHNHKVLGGLTYEERVRSGWGKTAVLIRVTIKY